MSGGLLVAGRAFGDTTRDGSDWALMSYSAGGQLDNTFGDHGIVRTQFGTGRDQASALALTPGRAIAVGAIYDSLGVGRYLTR
jgi:hypothetical protein